MDYERAYAEQQVTHARVLEAREASPPGPIVGEILLVEHDPPVITVSRRQGAGAHLLATPAQLEASGVEVQPTDRGGDITYHGPGQLVAYPILDLNRLGLGLHAYMRALEEAIIRTCAEYGIQAKREPGMTGVWIGDSADSPPRKIAALGVRVRRWVSMHGLALNVTTNLDHFGLIVPCGLAGRAVTSLGAELGDGCPPMARVKNDLCAALASELGATITRG